jgi:hypothetical protein
VVSQFVFCHISLIHPVDLLRQSVNSPLAATHQNWCYWQQMVHHPGAYSCASPPNTFQNDASPVNQVIASWQPFGTFSNSQNSPYRIPTSSLHANSQPAFSRQIPWLSQVYGGDATTQPLCNLYNIYTIRNTFFIDLGAQDARPLEPFTNLDTISVITT